MDIKNISLGEIQVSEVALRGCDEKNLEFMELKDSIGKVGVLESILVQRNPEGGYLLVNGLQRYTASKLLGLTEIPAIIEEMTDSVDIQVKQIITNSVGVATKPVEYTKQLVSILNAKPRMSLNEMCELIHKSPNWLNDRLKLLRLPSNIQEQVNEGEICLSNAFALSTLPENEVENFVGAAMTETAAEFTPKIAERNNEIKKEKAGIKVEAKFIPKPKARKANIIDEMRQNAEALSHLFDGLDAKTAFVNALNWVMQMDEESIAIAEREFQEKKDLREEKRKIAKEKRAKAKLDKAKALMDAEDDSKADA